MATMNLDISSQEADGFAKELEQARNELLDLSFRNRALSLRPDAKSSRILKIVNELSAQVYDRLVEKSRPFTFTPTTESASVDAQSEDEGDDDIQTGENRRHSDSQLQTTLPSDALAKCLVKMERDARTAIEEQGTNLLFLTLGQLEWYEDDHSDSPLHAPLLIVPVTLGRNAVADTETRRYRLAFREGEEIFGNVSLIARLIQSFGLTLPAPETEEESFSPEEYFQSVEKKTKTKKRWRVLPNAITLGFFSFQKYLMYLDLRRDRWPEGKRLEDHPLFGRLLLHGMPPCEPPFPDDVAIDDLIPPDKLEHVVDADSSQTLAIEKVRQGMNLVIQGPPGTGKSQTITNLIATAVLSGKRVLFVAEKMAALDVVKRRLDHEGLGPIFLELHGAGQSSARMLASIMQAWRLGAPVFQGESRTVTDLTRSRDAVNELPLLLHTPILPAELTPYQIIGTLCILGDDGLEVRLEGAELWTPESLVRRSQAADDFGNALETVGLPESSIWRGVGATHLLHLDLSPLSQMLFKTLEDLESLNQAAQALATSIKQRSSESLGHLADQITIAQALISVPDMMDRSAIADAVWDCGREGLSDLLDCGQRLADCLAATDGHVLPIAHERDWTAVRACLTTKQDARFKILSAAYRKARKVLKGVLTGAPPKNDAERIALLDSLLTIAQCRATLTARQDLACKAFGSLWCGEKTNWEHARSVLGWAEAVSQTGLDQEFRELVGIVPSKQAIMTSLQHLEPLRGAALAGLQAIADALVLDWQTVFGMPLEEVAFPDLAKRLEDWNDNRQLLPDWSRYIRTSQALDSLGMHALVEEAIAGRLDPSMVETSFRRSFYAALIRKIIREQSVLADFEGNRHDQFINEFRKFDKKLLDVARYRVLDAHHKGLPGSDNRIGDIGFLRGEAERKRNRRSIRTILGRAGSIVQSIKPVFLMSPLSVAQYLEPGGVEFDLLIFDEASQVKPIDALGAIARARQVVVVGDSKQLPPTSFFDRLSSDDDENEDDESDDTRGGLPAESKTAPAKAMESILSLCVARGVPETSLRWHYRSRHQSLIAVSNSEFYDNSLFIVPSPFQNGHGGLGVRFHPVEGCYDRARSRTNRPEARTVIAAIQTHARDCPNLSLGVATFSTAQRDAILDELESARRTDPALDAYIGRVCHEPFFVKNLESVQGDERDVIFISVGYGRDASGYISTNFGPINGIHGARRLNVLFSRAKCRCEVFSSMTDEDIDIRGNPLSRGVMTLKTFLRYARTGLLELPRAGGREEDSPFEKSVLRAIEAMGYEADVQVGQSGFFIDIAIIDPDCPGRYLLGVECDRDISSALAGRGRSCRVGNLNPVGCHGVPGRRSRRRRIKPSGP